MDEISKKELLAETGISYGQLYRWKREGLIPEEWFVKRSSFTGQETFFPRDRIIERVAAILGMKDEQSLEEIRRKINGESDDELDALIREATLSFQGDAVPNSVVLFETNDGKHYLVLVKDGSVIADNGVKILRTLSEKEIRGYVRAARTTMEQGGK